ncbi:MAG TPA: protein-L-isoaspartate O-methyltransferase, partial [Spirochaetia bacterium]|nr:protein-L-isoaspartate O-methyltransferase [Spirochaetia bacterium]
HEIEEKSLLEAFLLTPREWFCRPFNLPMAYADSALPIGYGQMIPSPSLALRMVSLLDPAPGEKVLEIGTGSGYEAALLAQLTREVYTIEIIKPLAEETNHIFDEHVREMPRLGVIHRRIGDGYYGWAKEAPFDRIIVTAGIDHLPPELLSQLGPGGVMVVPIGPPSGQTLLKVTKEVGEGGKTIFVRKAIPDSRVVLLPMTNASGGTHDAND